MEEIFVQIPLPCEWVGSHEDWGAACEGREVLGMPGLRSPHSGFASVRASRCLARISM